MINATHARTHTQVTAVHAGGAGAIAGMEVGDLITECNGEDAACG